MKIYRVLALLTGTKIILNCGSDHGIALYDKFEIFGLTKPLIDPETQELLGEAEVIRGKGTVTHIQNKLCTVESNLIETGTTRVIKKSNPFDFTKATEEEITGETRIKNFDSIQIGDFARLIKK